MSLALRVVLSGGMLAVLVWRLPDVHWKDLGPRWTDASPWWLIGAGSTMFAAFALSALRWQRVLDALHPTPPFPRMLNHFLAGQFVSNVLPSAFGGDVLRVSRLGRDIGDNARAFASVTIDRMTGWLVLPVITFAGFLLQAEMRSLGSRTTFALAVASGVLVFLVITLLTASNRRFGVDGERHSGWRRYLVSVHFGVDALRRHPADAVEVVLVGIAFQTMQCVAVWMAAHAIGLHEVTLGVALAVFPVVAIVQNVPIGLGGTGVREGLFVFFFGALGAPKALSITLGLVVYLLTIVTSALGAPAFAMGGRRERRTSRNHHSDDVTRVADES